MEKEAVEADLNHALTLDSVTTLFFGFLEKYRNMSMSLSMLKRRLSEYNLKRKKTDDHFV